MVNASQIKTIIGVMSGKGGVGKSTVSFLAANALALKGFKVGVLDADITGPSIPRLFQMKRGEIQGQGDKLLPFLSKQGIAVISMNLLLEDENKPIVWRGPLLAKAIEQFWDDVAWGELDFLVVDMPPGTADVALTIMQKIPLDGLLVVTTPQDMVSMIVNKSIQMAEMLNIPVLGVIENMSSIICPKCGESFSFFPEPKDSGLLKKIVMRIPQTKEIAAISDQGLVTTNKVIHEMLEELSEKIIKALASKKQERILK